MVLSTTSTSEALDALDALKPDLIFADISMPEINGMEIAEKIMEQFQNKAVRSPFPPILD